MRFLPQELIRAKRDGRVLTADEIETFISGLIAGEIGEGQAAAFCMAVCWRGLDLAECVALTDAMTRSGTVLSWDLPGPVLDKHSTGGVGDAVSLVLAPAVAACGGFMPKISGRGLGHTGGTLDKLDAIPGYRSQPDLEAFRRIVREVGCGIVGQTSDLAPADKRLYAIRDVTATVESVDLIATSILAKKLAAGVHGLVLDVKTGSGALLAGMDEARALARRLVDVAAGAGLRAAARLTDMDAPLASAAGNALEVAYALDHLTGRRREPRFHEVVLALGSAMLVMGRLAGDEGEARGRLDEAFASGAAAERFGRMVAASGGPADLPERPDRHLARAPVRHPVRAKTSGRVVAVDTRALGLAVVALGGGRTRADESIDHAVGVTDLAGIGEEVGPDRPLAVIHARGERAAEAAADRLRRAYRICDSAGPQRQLVAERIDAA